MHGKGQMDLFNYGPQYLGDLSQDDRSRLFNDILDLLNTLVIPAQVGPFVYAYMQETTLLQQIRNNPKYKLWQSMVFNQALRALKLDGKIADRMEGNRRLWKRLETK